MYSDEMLMKLMYIDSIATFMLIFMIIEPIYLKLKYSKKRVLSLVFKCAATLTALILAVIGALYQGNLQTWLLCMGLAVCVVADCLISFSFIGGLTSFLCAHLLFISAFSVASPFHILSIPIFVAGISLLYLILHKYKIKNKIVVPGIAYFIVILGMVSLALPIAYTSGVMGGFPKGLPAATGALLFMGSDILLARNAVYKYSKKTDIVSLTMYYLGIYSLSIWAVIPGLIK